MAERQHVEVILEGEEAIRGWRSEHPGERLNLREAKLSGAVLSGTPTRRLDLSNSDFHNADLRGANLSNADLSYSYLFGANLSRANLSTANLMGAHLTGADLGKADLRGAYLPRVDFIGANLSGANLREADLRGARLIDTHLDKADLTGCYVYGVSAWDVSMNGTIQLDLVITPRDMRSLFPAPEITVDNLEVAQFMYLLLYNEKISHMLDTVTSKTVLILGRFTKNRKRVLDAIRQELRKHDYIPIMFDFDETDNQDITDTVTTLARMAKFIIADITDPRCIPHELMAIVPNQTTVAVQPLLLAGEPEYAMFKTIKRYPWVLPTHEYNDLDELIRDIPMKIVRPAEVKVAQLRQQ